MRWFGESWGAPVCEDTEHARTPVGKRCMRCDVVVVEGDKGLLIPYMHRGERPWHLACWFDELGITELVRHQRPVTVEEIMRNPNLP